MNGMPDSFANAFANIVFPVPGGPTHQLDPSLTP